MINNLCPLGRGDGGGKFVFVFLSCLSKYILRVPDQNGISQTCYIVEIYHSGLERLISLQVNSMYQVTECAMFCQLSR